jgi:sphingolipid 4-desaturase/C4-monooxygenase
MSETEVDFVAQAANAETPELLWHKRRRQAMLRVHPEIRELFGPTAATHLMAVGAVAAHVVVAVASARASAMWAVLAAYVAGAWLCGAQGSAAHEYGHRLVRGPRWLAWLMVRLCTTTTASFVSTFFYHRHWGHHHSQGSQKKNESHEFVDHEGWNEFVFLTLPASGRPGLWCAVRRFVRSQWQIASSTFRATVVTIVGSILLVLWSLLRREPIRPVVRDAAIDSALKLGCQALLFSVAGWPALLYVACSAFFVRGFLAHPYLAWWLAQHHLGAFFSPHEYVATGSVHGPVFNLLTTNGGKHCEHHDFPQVPWHRLPAIAKIAPEYYRHVPPERTWWNLVWNYYWRTDLTFAYGYHPLRDDDQREPANVARRPATGRFPLSARPLPRFAG